MWIKRETYERLVSEAALALQVPKLELRAEAAEDALAIERHENSKAQRHWASMFLRREKTYPLPATAEEKVEAKAAQVEAANKPPVLTADQRARRDALRKWARTQGLTQEEADRSFMAQLSVQVEE